LAIPDAQEWPANQSRQRVTGKYGSSGDALMMSLGRPC
jgi:hypothetical protein